MLRADIVSAPMTHLATATACGLLLQLFKRSSTLRVVGALALALVPMAIALATGEACVPLTLGLVVKEHGFCFKLDHLDGIVHSF